MSRRRRLDVELVRRGLTATRAEAQSAVEAGLVTVDGAPALKSARQVSPDQALGLLAPPRDYVSRGGDKLAHALEVFALEVEGRHALDAGASTGGFTDVLLQRGARRVVAVDVGYGQLHDRLRRDARVIVRERTHVRDLVADALPTPPADLVVADLSFISLAAVLPTLREVCTEKAEAVVLVKPQFEAGRDQVGRGGVVRDPQVWHTCLQDVAGAAAAVGWAVRAATASPRPGPAGNVEFLLHLGPDDDADEVLGTPMLDRMLAAAVAQGRRVAAGSQGEIPRAADPQPGATRDRRHDEGGAS